MYYIETAEITAARLLAGTTLDEDPTPAWASGTFAVGDERHVAATHRVYRCAVAGSSTLSPQLDAARWQDRRPTNRMAPFDWYTDTAAESTTDDIVYAISARFANAVALYGLAGRGVSVEVRDAPGGALIWRYPAVGTALLRYPARGYWDYAYGDRRARPTLVLRDLPIRANAEITITVTGAEGARRAIGMIALGKLRSLGGAGLAGVLDEPQVVPRTFTYRKTDEDGRQQIKLRGSARDLSYQLVMERRYADAAVVALDGLLSRPVPHIVSLKPGFAALTAFGLLSRAPVRYRNAYAYIDVSIEGFV